MVGVNWYVFSVWFVSYIIGIDGDCIFWFSVGGGDDFFCVFYCGMDWFCVV